MVNGRKKPKYHYRSVGWASGRWSVTVLEHAAGIGNRAGCPGRAGAAHAGETRGALAMHPLPVVATTVAAYRLVARKFPTVVRLSWAVLAIVGMAQLFLASSVLGHMAAELGRGNIVMAAAIARDPLWLTLKFGIDAVGTAIVAVAIHELVLFDEHKPGTWVHIAFGRREALFAALGLALVAVTVPFATIVISPFGDPT